MERHAGRVDPMTALIKHGMLLQSAHGPLPNVAEMIAGEPIRGSWWNHPASRSIFDALNQLADSPDVVRMRLVNGKVTLVHRRLWPALVRIADRFPAKNLAAIHEEHTASGAHRVQTEAFPDWVPDDVLQAAEALGGGRVDRAACVLPTVMNTISCGDPAPRASLAPVTKLLLGRSRCLAGRPGRVYGVVQRRRTCRVPEVSHTV